MNPDFIKKIALSLAITIVLVAFVNVIGELTVCPRAELPYPEPGVSVEKSEAGTAEPSLAKAQTEQVAAVGLNDLLAAYDPAAGKNAFRKCKTCHTFEKGAKNRVGPNLWNVVGREKGSIEGFKYSDAMKLKGGVWSYEDLDRFLTKPRTFVMGTKMSIKGYPNPADRAPLIGFLRALSDDPMALPQ